MPNRHLNENIAETKILMAPYQRALLEVFPISVKDYILIVVRG